MKKCCTSFVFLALLFVFSACPAPGVNEDNSSYIIKMKALSSKTFSYFTLDEQEDEIRIKEELVFSSFDEENNTISASLFAASWDSENKTQRGEKIEDMSFTPSEFKKLSFSLDNQRQIDNSLTFENKTFEECSQEYKWAKILENKKWEHVFELEHQKMEFFEIDLQNKKMNMYSSTNAGGTEEEYSGEYYYDIEKKQMYWSNDYPSQYSNFFNIKENSFKKQYQTGSGFIKYDKVENWT